MPTFVAYPHVFRDGSITPGQHASFLGKVHDPLFFTEDPNAADFRLPELSLPAGVPMGRLENRRELQKLVDRQSRLLDYSAAARGIDAYYERAISMLNSDKLRHAFDLTQEPDKVRDAYGRTTYGQSCLLGAPAGRGGRAVRHRLLLRLHRRPEHRKAAAGTRTASTTRGCTRSSRSSTCR